MSKVYAKVTIKGTRSITLNAYVDTGADRTLVSPLFVKKAGLQKVPQTDFLELPNRQVVEIPLYSCDVIIQGLKTADLVGEYDISEDMVLGHDIMETLPGRLEIKGKNLIVKNRWKGKKV